MVLLGGICLCKTALRHGIIQAVMVADKENFTCAQPWAVAQVKLLSAYAECTVNVIIRSCEPGAQNSCVFSNSNYRGHKKQIIYHRT